MPKAPVSQQYVVLPPGGLRGRPGALPAEAQQFLQGLAPGRAWSERRSRGRGARAQVQVIDSIGPDGARLIEASPESVLALRASQPGLRVVPVVYYTPAVVRPERVESRPVAAAGPGPAPKITLRVVSKGDGAPVAKAIVVAFVDFEARQGAQGVTNANGEVSLVLGGAQVTLDRLYVYPVTGHWSFLKKRAPVSDGTAVTLQPLDLSAADGLRHFYPNAAPDGGAGVKVGVVDTGVAPHPDLAIDGGANTVPGENPSDFGDNGQGHGTHVAGIVAARGTPPKGLRGVAPGVTLRSYRVFPANSGQASSFAIAKGIDQAVSDGCDLVNLSLGGGPTDEVLKAAVEDARTAGSLCIVASGNGGRSPVSFPAWDAMVVAVSAVGRKGTFPRNSTEADAVARPFGTDKADFIAQFSNIGPEIDLTGPGVGIMSTYPGGYAEISGTSMACPAVTGVAARLLAKSDLLGAPRNADRSAGVVKLLLASAKSLGFTSDLEGHGLPQPR